MSAATAITLAAVGTVLLTAVLALYIATMRERRRLETALDHAPDELERFLGQEVIVNTRRPDDQALKGTLTEVGSTWLELHRAAWLPTTSSAGSVEPMDGAALVPRSHIAYVQALTAAPAAVLVRP